MSAPTIKLKIRTVKNVPCDIEIATDQTILDVKKQIESQYKHPVASQRLIFSGKVLEDNQTVASCNILPEKILILYLKDPVAAPKPATTTTPSTPATTTTAQPPSTPVASQPAGAPVTPASPTVPAATQGPVNNTTLSEQEFADAIQNIVDMGFDRTDASRALNAAYGDTARAVEYIVGRNIPNINQVPAGAAMGGVAAGGGPAQQQPAAAAQGQQGDINPNNPFAPLMALPQFQGLIALIQTNPALLEPLLQQLAAREPAVVDLIRQHKEEFLQILQRPVDPNVLQELQAAAAAAEEEEEYGETDAEDLEFGTGEAAQGGLPQGIPRGAQVIQITPQEKEAIDRLVALGFDRNRALEAFLVCNKDEEMAANYLFEQGDN